MPRGPAKNKLLPPDAMYYAHPESDSPLRPDVGTQAQFKKKKEPARYRYDSSLAPELGWDGTNAAVRDEAQLLVGEVLDAIAAANAATTDEARSVSLQHASAAAEKLGRLSRPYLDWAGKAERLSFDVPTLPLFVHERLSTRAIIETLKKHRVVENLFPFYGDPGRSVADQVLRAYEHRDKWVNRLILGDSLVVMNSLVQYEGLGGQVQMIYIDPPYGVKFGSNFQPFVRKRDVKDGDDADMTREPEVVRAYRDTWELGLHSYLTYLRDRLLLARELLHPSGSVFVQISDENLHHVREIMDEVFGADNFCSVLSFSKTSGLGATLLQTTRDFILWYAKNKPVVRFRQIYVDKREGADEDSHYDRDSGGRLYTLSDLTAQNNNVQSCLYDFVFEGQTFRLPRGRQWKTTAAGMQRLVDARRVVRMGNSIRYKRFVEDFPCSPITDTWHDIGGSVQSRTDPKVYAVQTGTSPIQRCMLMATDPGDLILDPTCGSGTTAYVAEQWGRRWITIDVSRVPLALARQRLLTATFPWYQLQDESRGPVGGFVYKRKKNNKGEEVGGVVPHVTLKSIATGEVSEEEVLVDRPEETKSIVRVTGPFVVEGTIALPASMDANGTDDAEGEAPAVEETGATLVERMIGVLRQSPVIHLPGAKTINFRNVRPPAKTLSLSAEALVDATAAGMKPTLNEAIAEVEEKNANALPFSQKRVAIVFGPSNGAINQSTVFEAMQEARLKGYEHLYVIGFAIEANARQFVENAEAVAGIGATYVQMTPDVLMGDLLKNMKSSQIFSVCGLPEIALRRKTVDGVARYEVELLGLDVYDPVDDKTYHESGADVPAWLLDTDYNGLCFHVSQAFFPRTGAWESLKKALKATHDESVWDHLSGTVSALFDAGTHQRIAVKVIDDRGNELLVVKSLEEAAP